MGAWHLFLAGKGDGGRRAHPGQHGVEPLRIASKTIKMTLSLGVSVCPPVSEDFEECTRAADAALCSAKAAGVNRVVRFSREI